MNYNTPEQDKLMAAKQRLLNLKIKVIKEQIEEIEDELALRRLLRRR